MTRLMSVDDDPLLDDVLRVLMAVAAGDCSQRVTVPEGDGGLAAIATAVNMLAEETSVRQSKERELQRRLLRAERAATAGRLAAGVAHEINNPAAFVLSNHNVLADYTRELNACMRGLRQAAAAAQDEAFARDVLETFERNHTADLLDEMGEVVAENVEGIRRIAGVVERLRTISPAGEADVEEADVSEIVEEACRMLRPEVERRARLTVCTHPLPPSRVTRAELMQVFTHLLANAAQAIAPGEPGPHEVEVRCGRAPEGVFISIKDSGRGMTQEQQRRLFDLSLSTRAEAGEMGLWISAEIIRRHGGELRCTSWPGKGTEMTVVLPAATTTAARDEAAVCSAASVAGATSPS